MILSDSYSVPSVVRCTRNLSFPEEDLVRFPWLGRSVRPYFLVELLQSGEPSGPTIPVLGYPCSEDGVPIEGADQVVIKLPNLGPPEDWLSTEIGARTFSLGSNYIKEWQHIRRRLHDSIYANPILDLGFEDVNGVDLSFSVQLFIPPQKALPLKKWLEEKRWRQLIEKKSDGTDEDNWNGITNQGNWLEIATLLAHALSQIHRKRVVHGDIWPPNIFVTNCKPYHAIFIDFMESFLAAPSGDPHVIQKNHPYRAPERASAEYVPSEQVDVYSFGKLLLYLTIGIDILIDRNKHGHERRLVVRDAMLKRNNPLVKKFPSVVDIVARCTAWDPVARPRMIEIYDELLELATESPTPRSRDTELARRLNEIATSVQSGFTQHNSIFLRIIEKKIREIEHLIDTYKTEMVELSGTRDQLIAALLVLFHELNDGDSWSAITTPAVWQEAALGLDGRYATGTIQAVRRGASIHRTFVVSIEELGLPWAQQFADRLAARASITQSVALAALFRRAIYEFKAHAEDGRVKDRGSQFHTKHIKRFVGVISSLKAMVSNWELQDSVTRGKFTRINETKGLFLGLLPVSTLTKVWEQRTKNPLSVMYTSREPEVKNRWLLVMTDLRGRNENEPDKIRRPELRGIRIFKSVLLPNGYPRDRVIELERLMRDEAQNMGEIIELVDACAQEVPIPSDSPVPSPAKSG